MDLDIRLVKVTHTQMPVLKNLMQLYKYDFSEFDSADVDANGIFDYKCLDHYSWEPGRFAFLIEADGQWAGFALIMHLQEVDSGTVYYWMAEFFVLKKYRRCGVGGRAAGRLFSTFPGTWRVAQLHANQRAQSFWRRIIGDYTAGDYDEVNLKDWDGAAQQFIST